MNRNAVSLVFLLALGLCAACEKPSSEVKTGDIEAIIHVELSKTYSRLSVDMLDGLTHVSLVKGDSLSAKTDKDEALAFGKSASLYVVDLPHDDISTVTVSLTRASGNSAPASTVAVPPHFVFTSPTQVSYAAGAAKFTWSNPVDGSDVTYFVQPCNTQLQISTEQKAPISDAGTLTIPISELAKTAPPAGGTCVTIDFVRRIEGTADKAFASKSTIDARRDEYVDVTIAP